MEDRMCAAFFTVAFVASILVSSTANSAPDASLPSQNPVETVAANNLAIVTPTSFQSNSSDVQTPNPTLPAVVSTAATLVTNTTVNPPPSTPVTPSNITTPSPITEIPSNNITTPSPNDTTTTTTPPKPTPPPTTTTISPSNTTTESTTAKTPATTISTMKPDPIPTTTSSSPTAAPTKDRRFDGPSFVGGIVLCLGILAISFVAFKFYKARTERNYHTL